MRTPVSNCDFERSALTVVGDPKPIVLNMQLVGKGPTQERERFYADGTWEFDFLGTILKNYSGKWKVDGDKIITFSKELGEVSRTLRKNSEGAFLTDSMVMIVMEDCRREIPLNMEKIVRRRKNEAMN